MASENTTIITQQEAEAMLPSLVEVGAGGNGRTTTTVYGETRDAPIKIGCTVEWGVKTTWWRSA